MAQAYDPTQWVFVQSHRLFTFSEVPPEWEEQRLTHELNMLELTMEHDEVVAWWFTQSMMEMATAIAEEAVGFKIDKFAWESALVNDEYIEQSKKFLVDIGLCA